MKKSVLIVSIWVLLWSSIGLSVGLFVGTMGWFVIPLSGFAYGVAAGGIYTLIGYIDGKFTKVAHTRYSVVVANISSLLAVIAFQPIIGLDAKTVIRVTVICGTISGIVLSTFYGKVVK